MECFLPVRRRWEYGDGSRQCIGIPGSLLEDVDQCFEGSVRQYSERVGTTSVVVGGDAAVAGEAVVSEVAAFHGRTEAESPNDAAAVSDDNGHRRLKQKQRS